MKFNLPSNIQQQVIQYDATAKKQAAVMAAIDAANKPKSKAKLNSCGRPSRMIPSDIITDRDWEEALDYINTTPVSQGKVMLFTKPVFGGPNQVKAFVYFYKQMWVAGWLPRKQDDGYFYGLTWAYKDTKTAYKYCDKAFINKPNSIGSYLFHGDDGLENSNRWMPAVKQGRVTWRRKTVVFDQHMIDQGYTSAYWRCVDETEHNINNWHNNSRAIYSALRRFEQQLAANIPTFKGRWSHCNHMFQRVSSTQNTLEYLLSQFGPRPSWCSSDDTYQHDVDWIIKQISRRMKKPYLVEIWNAPWFRKLLLGYMRRTETAHIQQKQQHEYDLDELCKPYNQLDYILKSCEYIRNKWRTCDLNYLHSRLHLLSRVNLWDDCYEETDRWLEDNLPVESFLNMLQQKYDKLNDEDNPRRGIDENVGYWIMRNQEYSDTFSMVEQCLVHMRRHQNPIELKLKPKRWRLSDWHDQLMSETWKIRNPNEKLPQKLFPELIEITALGDSYQGETDKVWKIFQPRDTHALARWGQAARNCVGNSNYSKGIKQCKHMIILIMVDNAPKYTIQTTFDNGEMTVSQITKVENGRQEYRLEPAEHQCVESMLHSALNVRSRQLS